MAICVASQIVSGVTVLSPSGVSVGSCTDFVLYTAAEYAALSPLLTPVDVALLASMVVAVWAVAYSIKVLRRAL